MFSNLLFVCIKVMTWLASWIYWRTSSSLIIRAILYENSWTLRVEISISIFTILFLIYSLIFWVDLIYKDTNMHAITCSLKTITRLFLILTQLFAISFIANSGDVIKTRNRKGFEMLHSSSNYYTCTSFIYLWGINQNQK